MPYADPDAQRQYQREWKARRRRDWFADKACARCGSRDDLEVDHLDPNTKVAHSVWSWSKARRETELAKCQVLCHDHHLQKTLEGQECARGEKNGNSKLTPELVTEARRLYASGRYSYQKLAERYGFSSKGSMRLAIIGVTWKHVPMVRAEGVGPSRG